MSELSVGQLKGLTINNNLIEVPNGHALYTPGSAIQTRSVKFNTATVYSTASYTQITSLTLTPRKNTSDIFMSASLMISGVGGFQITRNGTTIFTSPSDGTGPYMFWESPNNQTSPSSSSPRRFITINFIDSPSSTLPITYSLQIRPYNAASGTGQIMICEGNTFGSFLIQEVAQ